MLNIDYSKRETFAYACEAFGYLLAHADARADRIRLLDELAHTYLPSDDRVDAEEYLDILAAAIKGRMGWKCILDRCKPAKSSAHPRHPDR